MQSTDMLTDEKVSVRDYDYCLSFSIYEKYLKQTERNLQLLWATMWSRITRTKKWISKKTERGIAEIVIRRQKLREAIDEIVVDSRRSFGMRKFVKMMTTCRNFRQVVVVRFLRTTTNVSQFVTQGVTNSVVLKNNIADHFHNLTEVVEFDHFKNGEFATINAKLF